MSDDDGKYADYSPHAVVIVGYDSGTWPFGPDYWIIRVSKAFYLAFIWIQLEGILIVCLICLYSRILGEWMNGERRDTVEFRQVKTCSTLKTISLFLHGESIINTNKLSVLFRNVFKRIRMQFYELTN